MKQTPVRPKKHLGQHFLTDLNIAQNIVSLVGNGNTKNVLEVGPGMGVLTQYLLEDTSLNLSVAEIDTESVEYLKTQFRMLDGKIYEEDFLKMDLKSKFNEQVLIVGNFPYNISSQIFFKVLEFRDIIPQVVGMVQKEVGQRICEKEGSKIYGILSVLLQAFYDVSYEFTVHENVFNPPPKVKSAVIKLNRKPDFALDCNEKLFFSVVKQAFGQRRKTLRNSLKSLTPEAVKHKAVFDKRPEQLSVEAFLELTNLINKGG
ncbi:MAG: 16S rRNA (adenine(1518)-N(6)/adenine(1519)-N(6))-dimethyltransferase RsmA [Bacteroidales bacterium]